VLVAGILVGPQKPIAGLGCGIFGLAFLVFPKYRAQHGFDFGCSLAEERLKGLDLDWLPTE
jgi:hypothetical protein